MSGNKEYRQPYEFDKPIKREIRTLQKNKCAVTGKEGYTEVHHMLGVALAHGYFPTVDPGIFAQKENAIALSPDIHKQLHDEMANWPPEFTKVFVIGMYKYLRDIYKEKQAKIEKNKVVLGSGGRRRIG